MKVNSIKTVGFRKFKDKFETNLYDITSITGANTRGKTNILYAIIWAFLGTNLAGDDKVWLGNKNSDECCVELNFTDNQGQAHTLVRYKNKYDSKKNFISLDNRMVSQDNIQEFYSDKKLFLSILNPNYFINKKTAEQKELLDKYLPKIDMKLVYDKLDESEKEYLEGIPQNVTEYIKELNSNKRMYQDKIQEFIGKVDYAKNIENTNIGSKKVFEKSEELSLERQELEFLKNENNSINKVKQQNIVDKIINEITHLTNKINDLKTQIDTNKKYYLKIANEEESYCLMCEQKIENVSKATTLKNIKAEIEEMSNDKIDMEQELLELKKNLAIEKCVLNSLNSKSNEEIENNIMAVENQIKQLEQEQIEIEKYNNSIEIQQKNIESAKRDIELFENKIKEFRDMIDNIDKTKNIAQKLYINYLEEKMKFATQHFKNVKVQYYSILKDSGEIKEDFIIHYKDNELKNLSRSENIATSLEFANMFNKISGINAPLFIDDSESCADYNFIEEYSKDTQVLIARVEKGQDLKIQEGCLNNSEYLQVA